MITRKQRTVLFFATLAGVYAFFMQPMVDVNGRRLGWHYFALDEVLVGPRLEHFVPHPDYAMLATEYIVLAFLTVCLYFGGRDLQE